MGGGNTSPRVLCFPMHHKKLLLAVLGIVVFVTASYFVVSPYVRNVMEEEESMYALRNKQNPSSTTEIEVEDLESENDLSKEAESVSAPAFEYSSSTWSLTVHSAKALSV